MRKISRNIFFIALTSLLISSCGLFRKKNRCHTCPSWSKNVEQFEESQIEK